MGGILAEHHENRNETGVGGRSKWCAAEAVIARIDESRSTGVKSPRSRKIINPLT